MSIDGGASLTVALGGYARGQAFRAGIAAAVPGPIEYADISPISRAFSPMVREQKFDISEMAIVTFLQARAYGKPLVLLPLVVAARFQEAALLCRAADDSISGPADLSGKRVGVRAYGQTTAVWLRGILGDDFAIAPEQVRWVTFEDAHVTEYEDPPWAERAPQSSDMLAMLNAGELDAVIVGNDVPADPGIRTVFADPAAVGQKFKARHGFMPVNHLIVARATLVEGQPDVVAALIGAISSGLDPGLPRGRTAIDPAIGLVLRFAKAQGLLPRELTLDEVWQGLPAALQEIRPPA